jgi:hypothetical protein
MLSGEAANTNFIVFGLTRPGLEPTIYCTRGEHAKHYTTDSVEDNSIWVDIDLTSDCVSFSDGGIPDTVNENYDWLIDCCLMPILAVVQLYLGIKIMK